jgi:beta-1,4-N-acetylglucosaminyltransferase
MKKIGIISSCGGHLAEVRRLASVYEKFDHFFVVNDRVDLPDDMKGRTSFIHHSERDWKLLINFWEAWRILRRERPNLLLSTGAGPMVPFAIVAKLLDIRIIFIEIGNQVVHPSLTGRIMYRLADRFYFQWKGLQPFFPRGIYGGLLL